MTSITIQCDCGQRYAFDVEPVADRMPCAVQCPACGADGTAAANAIIAQTAASQNPPGAPKKEVFPPPVPPSAFRVKPRSDESARSTAPAVPAARSLTDTDGTVATNPVRLRPNYIKLLLAQHPLEVALSVVAACIGVGFAWVKNPAPLCIVFIALLAYVVRLILGIRSKYWNGDVCPGIVISEKPWHVAVMTDLGFSGLTPKPAVLVLPQRLNGMTGGLPRVGQRVATVAEYHGPPKDSAWQNFSPEVINCGVTDPAEIRRVMNSIPDEEWQALEGYLHWLPEKKPGLYKMWGANAGKADPTPTWVKAAAVVAGVFVVLIGAVIIGKLFFGSAHNSEPQTKQTIGSPGRYAPPGFPSAPQTTPTTPSQMRQPPIRPPATGGASANSFAVGDTVEVNWLGQWRTASVVDKSGPIVFVRIDDPAAPSRIGMHTSLVRAKK